MNLNQLNLTESLLNLKQKKISSQELTQACLDRINQTDKSLHAFLALNPMALDQAKAADKIVNSSTDAFERYPLLGIPYCLKDNFLTENLRTTASSRMLDQFIPPYSATVYQKLTQAGAILLGKTNMDAWAHGSSTETSDYGPTLNPWNLGYLPGGSSGGSAASVAADQCIFSIGSETAGSIRQPASWCGVTGFKPSYGRVSRYGVIAMASSTDSPGPLTKTVTDAALVTAVIAGHDPYDATTSSKVMRIKLAAINKTKDLAGLKLGLPQEYLLKNMNQPAKQLILQAVKVLEKAGAKVKKISLLDPQYAIGVYTIVQRSEVSSNLARYDGIRYGFGRQTFGEEAKKRIILGSFALSSGYYDQYYNRAQKVRTLIINQFRQVFQKLDLIIGPVSPGPALPVGASKNQPMFGEMEDILLEASSVAGLTSLSLPCGFVKGLPIGLQITGPQFAEGQVLAAGAAYQRLTNWHQQKPKLKYD